MAVTTTTTTTTTAASLLSLPVETSEHILDFVDTPADVLALALTCRELAQLAVPTHLQYRKIVGNTVCERELWEHLYTHPHLARHVRHFAVERFGTRRVPAAMLRNGGGSAGGGGKGKSPACAARATPPSGSAETQDICSHLARALGAMTQLVRFRWHTGERSDTLTDTQVWTELQAAQELRELSLFLFRIESGGGGGGGGGQGQQATLLPLNTVRRRS
jgi:hypothetical protein